MTGWAGPARQPERLPERLGLIDSLLVILLPWLDPQAAELANGPCPVAKDGPCVRITEPEAQ